MTSMPLSVPHPPSLDTTTCIYDGDSWSAYMPKLHAELTYPTPVGHTTFSIYIINLKRPCLTYRLGILMTKARNTFRFDFVWLWPLSRCITSSHKCKKPLRISAKSSEGFPCSIQPRQLFTSRVLMEFPVEIHVVTNDGSWKISLWKNPPFWKSPIVKKPELQDQGFIKNVVNKQWVPSSKLTWQWKMDLLKMYSLLKMGIFHCHVSLLECNSSFYRSRSEVWPARKTFMDTLLLKPLHRPHSSSLRRQPWSQPASPERLP